MSLTIPPLTVLAEIASIVSVALSLLSFVAILRTKRAVDAAVRSVRMELLRSAAIASANRAISEITGLRAAARKSDWIAVVDRAGEARKGILTVRIVGSIIGLTKEERFTPLLSQLGIMETQAEKAISETASIEPNRLARIATRQMQILTEVLAELEGISLQR